MPERKERVLYRALLPVLCFSFIGTASAWHSSVVKDEFTNDLTCSVVEQTYDWDHPNEYYTDFLDKHEDLKFAYLIDREVKGKKIDFLIIRGEEVLIPKYIKFGDKVFEGVGGVFRDYDEITQLLIKGSKVKVRANSFLNTMDFEFSLSGFTKAYNQTKKECGTKK